MQSRTKVWLVVIALIILIGLGFIAFTSSTSQNQNSSDTTTTTTNSGDTTSNSNDTSVSTSTNTSVTTQSAGSYTLADVATHNSQSSCWTIVNGKVYDITKFIPIHPGGKVILQACGKDATSIFQSQRQHARVNAQATLDTYAIGKLTS